MIYTRLDVDDSFVTVAPLGGKHVNHFWRLLNRLDIPHVTLLDLDYGRNGGGWGRVKYVCEKYYNLHGTDVISGVPAWNNDSINPIVSQLPNRNLTALQYLEEVNVFFSDPLDIDFSMQSAFPEFYKITFSGETGPQESDWVKLKKAVLKKGYSETLSQFYSEQSQKDDFKWYRYRFLGNKGKPTSHLYALENLDFSQAGVQARIPSSLMRLVRRVEDMIKGLPE